MTDATDASNAGLSAIVAPLDRDIECVRCSYNLRGLLPDGACPECGAAVQESIRHCLSIYYARWLRGLAQGIWLIFAGVVSSVVAGVVLLKGGMVFLALAFLDLTAVGCAAVLGCQLLVIAGFWLFTKPEPGGRLVRRSNTVGWIGRGATIAHCLGWLVVLLAQQLHLLAILRFHIWLELRIGDVILLLLVGSPGVATAAFAYRCHRLGQWLPARVLAWQLVMLPPSILAAISCMLAMVFFVPYDQPLDQVLTVASVGIACLLVLLILWLPVVLTCFAMALRRRERGKGGWH